MPGNWLQTFSGIAFDLDPPNPEQVRLLDIAHGLAFQCRFAGQTSKFYSIAQHSVLVSEIVQKAVAALPDRLPAAVVAEYALLALLHDAGEAYTCDVPHPVKVVQRRRAAELEQHLLELVEKIDKTIAADLPATPLYNTTTLLLPLYAAIKRTALYDVEADVLSAVHAAFDLRGPEHEQIVGWRSLADLIKLADLRALATERRDLMSAPPRSWIALENVAPWPLKIEPLSPDEAQFAFLVRFDELQRARGERTVL